MFRVECTYCLCKTCSRSDCRYTCDICFARCCSSSRPLTYCLEYHSNFRHKRYIITKKTLRASDYVSKMSVSDFMKMVVNLIDKERD